MRATRSVLFTLALATVLVRPAGATFHEMQIEQVIGGVDGATGVQAIQLRMRASLQNLVSNARLVARDAVGANPVVLIAFPSNVTGSAAGSRVLVATAGFSAATSPALTPDFVLTHAIPASYLAAGTLTYEDNVGTVLWRLSWGGAGYTGTGAGALTNDANGNFSPDFAGPLPSASGKALRFQGVASALSTTNAADYALTPASATFTNNAGSSGTVVSLVGVEGGASNSPLALGLPRPNPARQSLAYSVLLPRAARVRVRVLDLGGRVVRSLVDETLQAGQHGFAWATAGDGGPALASGVYFLELDAEGDRRMQRFVLIR
jgi:hypothetical protein